MKLRTVDGLELGAWFLAPGALDRGMAVLVAPGNAGNRSLRAPLAAALADRGLAVLLFDYRGYGGNRGRPTEAGLARDVRAALRFLQAEAGPPPERLLYYGESLGAAVVTELATEHPPAGLVLRSPFTDLASVGRVHYPFLPVRSLLRDRFPLAAQVARGAGADDGRVRHRRPRRAARAEPHRGRRGARPEAPGRDRGRRPQRRGSARWRRARHGGRRPRRPLRADSVIRARSFV